MRSMRFLFASLALLLMTGIPRVATGIDNPQQVTDENREHIIETFQRITDAINLGSSDVVQTFSSEGTFRELSRLKQSALYAPASVVRTMPTAEKVIVVNLRHRFSLKALGELNPNRLLQLTLDNGWLSRESVSEATLGPITFSSDKAIAVLLIQNEDRGNRCEFSKQQNTAWKMNVWCLIQRENVLLREASLLWPGSEDEWIMQMLESAEGKQISKTIWNPPTEEHTR